MTKNSGDSRRMVSKSARMPWASTTCTESTHSATGNMLRMVGGVDQHVHKHAIITPPWRRASQRLLPAHLRFILTARPTTRTRAVSIRLSFHAPRKSLHESQRAAPDDCVAAMHLPLRWPRRTIQAGRPHRHPWHTDHAPRQWRVTSGRARPESCSRRQCRRASPATPAQPRCWCP